MTDQIDIMVIAPFAGGTGHAEIDELVAFGRQLQHMGAGRMGIWLVSEDGRVLAEHMACRYGLPVNVLQADAPSHYLNEIHIALFTQEIAAVRPTFACVNHTSEGWEWAPAVAHRMGAGCICGVDCITRWQGRICFQKEAYAGKVKALYASKAATTVLSVMPGVFKAPPAPASAPGPISYRKASWPGVRIRHVGTRRAESHDSDITSAPVIVAVGNGIGTQENMALAHRLAACLPGAAVAGSRIICDRGWLAYSRQIGISGAAVAPDLYIACGISGASQHVIGMRGSKFVVAINTDPKAPIFNEADICILEDIARFIPLLVEALKELCGETMQPADGP